MDNSASALLMVAVIVIVLGAAGIWWSLRRPARKLQRRIRGEALAASERYTPAARVPVYGSPPAAAVQPPVPEKRPDPSDAGLQDNQRVAAMRALLQRGDEHLSPESTFERTLPMPVQEMLDDPASTAPMAWNPTQPSEDLGVIDLELPEDRPRRTRLSGDHEHVSL